MNDYLSRISSVLLSHSNSDTLNGAVREWEFVPPIADKGSRCSRCELCDTPIRFEYTIFNINQPEVPHLYRWGMNGFFFCFSLHF